MKNNNTLPAISCTLIIIFCVCVAEATPQRKLTAFIFGDSLVDAGNNDYIFTFSRANWPPYGIDFSASGGKPTGRFTNGRTISDIVGQVLGAKSYPPPYMAPTSHGSNILGGVNYASGAAGILNDTGSLFIGRISLAEQITNFENTKKELENLLGKSAAEQTIRDAIFSITIGANDFLNNYLLPFVSIPKRTRISPHDFESAMITQLAMQIRRLCSLGARKVVISAVGALGCIPYERGVNMVESGRCWEPTNEMVRSYNSMLRDLIRNFNAESASSEVGGATFLYADAYEALKEILENYEAYGFENKESPCCGDVIPPVACSERSHMCVNRAKYVFWDAYHPSEAANFIIANAFVTGGLRYVYPMNISSLFVLK